MLLVQFVVVSHFLSLKLLCVFCLCFASHAQSIATVPRSLAFAVSMRSYTSVSTFLFFDPSVKMSEVFTILCIFLFQNL